MTYYLSKFILLGVGSSTGTPKLGCTLNPKGACPQCRDATSSPTTSRNARANPCALAVLECDDDDPAKPPRHVLIDCGKTFRETALRLFASIGVTYISDVILTHDHMDATGGLDDLREVARYGDTTRVYCSGATQRSLETRLPYLCQKPPKDRTNWRWVASMAFVEPNLSDTEPREHEIHGTGYSFLTLPVEHGAGYTSLGFHFPTKTGTGVVYVSDVSAVYPATAEALASLASPGPFEVSIVDCLKIAEPMYLAHYSLRQSMEFMSRVAPCRRGYLMGLTHDVGYDQINAEIQSQYGSSGLGHVEMGYDGLVAYDCKRGC
eukprot:PhM_4_TR8202/c0_g1_i1/m.2725